MDTYNILITIHRAVNVPAADIHNLSADPYVVATLDAPSRPQFSDEPKLRWRTQTVRATRDPTWNDHWLVGGIPRDGFSLKLAVNDEDVKNHDDRLGVSELKFTKDMIHEEFDFREREVKVKKRRGSIVPYILTYLEGILPGRRVRKHNRVVLSVVVLGKTEDKNDIRVHTVGPNAYSLHFSPLIGSVVNRGNQFAKDKPIQQTGNEKKPASASTFVACKLQLTGPVPKELRHQYVGYNWFVKLLYSKKGLPGRILFRTLRRQYRTIYSYDKSTLYGAIDAEDEDEEGLPAPSTVLHPSEAYSRAMAKQFLEMTDYGRGGRLQTYVLTLDAQWRFCETGDELSIDFLSKHMMHADGEQIVAYAGEFFVRRISSESTNGDGRESDHGGSEKDGEDYDRDDPEDDDPSLYELVIDNDSGTYRPPESTLPLFQEWLSDKRRLGALGRVTVMHCFDEKLQALKTQRKEFKKRLLGGEPQKRRQVKRSGSSVSSIRVDGRKLSSGEVERIIAEQERDNEERLRGGDTRKEAGQNGTQVAESGQMKTPQDSGIDV